jgi:hypothetical protein
MPAQNPNSRQTLIEYALRALGAPVVQINVDWQQCEDRLDEALQFFSEYHFDGVQKVYFKYQLNQSDIQNKYISTTNINSPVGGIDRPTGTDIVSVIRLFRFGSFTGTDMFDVKYQMALSDYFGINRGLGSSQSLPLANYDITMQYISLIEEFFAPEKSIRFSKVTDKIYIDSDMSEISPNDYLIIEAYAVLDPDEYPKIYNDRLLKKYLTALIKKQWGANMAKYDGVQLPGGITFKGAQIYQDAINEIALIENELRTTHELPTDFMLG